MRDFDDVKWKTWQRARGLRREMTMPERVLWSKLRGEQLGVKFRRQHAIGEYIVDFVALQANLVIELDGNTHHSPSEVEHDRIRTEYLNSVGYRVLRFTNREVSVSLSGVIDKILEALQG